MISSKRRAIADSSRTMFMWVAGMSAVVGMCVVVAIFLGQQIVFKAEVVGKMTHTLNTLKDNNKVAGDLVNNVVVLETNQALNSLKATPEDKALQVVLDALPADRNSLALGASLQNSLLTNIDGLTVESITLDAGGSVTSTEATSDSNNTIPIQIQVSANNATAIKEMLLRLERSIRIIDIEGFTLERSDASYQASITAKA
ncbi:MAG: hypothetical protein ACM3KF_03935, partial [Acidobacteriota bacterium]